jgi:hypothetical protein
MASTVQGHIEGNIHGKPLAADVSSKIQDVLKATLEAEIAKERPTVGAAAAALAPSHGSVTHGSVTRAV